ncbi:unnamed protein product, partial [Dibothriocephalus latus]
SRPGGRKCRKHKITVDVDISFTACKSPASSRDGSRNVNSCLDGPIYTENSDNFVSIVLRRPDRDLFSREKSLEKSLESLDDSEADDFHTGPPADSLVDTSLSKHSSLEEQGNTTDSRNANRIRLQVRYTPSPAHGTTEPSPVVKEVTRETTNNQLFVSIADSNPPVNIASKMAVCSPEFRLAEEPISLKAPSRMSPEESSSAKSAAAKAYNIASPPDCNTAILQEDTSATMEIVEETLHKRLGRAQRIAKIVNEVELTEGERAEPAKGKGGLRNQHVAKVITDVNVVAKKARIVRQEDREMKVHTILYDVNETLQIEPLDEEHQQQKPRENTEEGNNANESTILDSDSEPDNSYFRTFESQQTCRSKHCLTLLGNPLLLVYERKGNDNIGQLVSERNSVKVSAAQDHHSGQSTLNALKMNSRKELSIHTPHQRDNQNSTVRSSIWEPSVGTLDMKRKLAKPPSLRKPSITHYGKVLERHHLDRYRSSSFGPGGSEVDEQSTLAATGPLWP